MTCKHTKSIKLLELPFKEKVQEKIHRIIYFFIFFKKVFSPAGGAQGPSLTTVCTQDHKLPTSKFFEIKAQTINYQGRLIIIILIHSIISLI